MWQSCIVHWIWKTMIDTITVCSSNPALLSPYKVAGFKAWPMESQVPRFTLLYWILTVQQLRVYHLQTTKPLNRSFTESTQSQEFHLRRKQLKSETDLLLHRKRFYLVHKLGTVAIQKYPCPSIEILENSMKTTSGCRKRQPQKLSEVFRILCWTKSISKLLEQTSILEVVGLRMTGTER